MAIAAVNEGTCGVSAPAASDMPALRFSRLMEDRPVVPACQSGTPAAVLPATLGGEPPSASPFRRVAGRQNFAQYGDRYLRASDRLIRDFDSPEEATAHARRLALQAGTPMAVIAEDGHYAVYRIESVIRPDRTPSQLVQAERLIGGDFLLRNIAAGGNSNATYVQSGHTELLALVTADAFVVNITDSGAGVLNPVSHPIGAIPPADGVDTTDSLPDQIPISALMWAFSLDPEELSREDFHAVFQLAMRDFALASLTEARRRIDETLRVFEGNDIALQVALSQLQALDRQIADKEREVDTARSLASHDVLRQREAELDELKAQRERRFPLLARIGHLDRFRDLDRHGRIAALRGIARDLHEALGTRYEDIVNGRRNLWTMDSVRTVVAAGLLLPEERLRQVEERAAAERLADAARTARDAVIDVAILCLSGAALAGAIPLLRAGPTLGSLYRASVNATGPRNVLVLAGPGGTEWGEYEVSLTVRALGQNEGRVILVGDGIRPISGEQILEGLYRAGDQARTNGLPTTIWIFMHGSVDGGAHLLTAGAGRIQSEELFRTISSVLNGRLDVIMVSCHSDAAASFASSLRPGSRLAVLSDNLYVADVERFIEMLNAAPGHDLSAPALLHYFLLAGERINPSLTVTGVGTWHLRRALMDHIGTPFSEAEKAEIRKLLRSAFFPPGQIDRVMDAVASPSLSLNRLSSLVQSGRAMAVTSTRLRPTRSP
jgi:hypothetical protein